MRLRTWVLLWVILAVAFCAQSARAADPATISFRKVFKSSNPEFVEIKVRENGGATYDIRSLSEDPDPQPFEVGPALVSKIFELSGQLNNFRRVDLDTKRRIANLGEKTFRYERGSESGEVKFNYTINSTANQLLMIFEGLARQQDHLRTLTHRMKYDRLGVNVALLNFESDLNHKILPEPERLLPVLEQISNDPRFVDIARQRARALIERIRGSKP
ncbi:MAG TPA: hypothetical protein VGQ11_08040 [Candidatus Acidoferrales bacterium]|jgi:hypothetical protein|nr:hypothetical protein [Candidatus Acidoferrales bacterium]